MSAANGASFGAQVSFSAERARRVVSDNDQKCRRNASEVLLRPTLHQGAYNDF